MTEHNIDSTVIKRTQETLGKYVKKPPLTEKLLKKPPFRFLHDIFNVVIKDTGCFAGLYTPEELNAENIKDRDEKTKFLQKMIDVIKLSTGIAITVRTSKIVAGQEPEKTNELLQSIAEVIEKKLDWKSAVHKVNSGKTTEKEKEVTKSKALDKPKETKTRDKPKEHIKGKEQHAKEPKTKEAKINSKLISPTSKVEKPPKKVTQSKEKEEIPGKTIVKNKIEKEHKEKVSSKHKEVAEKEKNTTKTKTEVKKKTPSPTLETKLDEKLPQEIITTKDENQNKVPIEKVNAAMKLETPNATKESIVPPTKETDIEPERRKKTKEISKTPTKETEIEPERRKKTKDILKTPTKEAEIEHESHSTKEAGEVEATLKKVVKAEPINAEAESEPRKSSAKRKSSSGKSRRSSEHKAGNEEQEQNSLQSTNNLDSLNTVSEERAPIKQPNETMVTQKSNNNNTSEVKRESTFTRDEPKNSTTAGSHHNNNKNYNNNHAIIKSNKHNTNNDTKISNNTATNDRPRTSLRPPSARPASARPGAPRRRDKNVEIVLQPNDQLNMTGINVKLETFGDFGDDDGENLVVIEDANVGLNGVDDIQAGVKPTTNNTEDSLEQQGHLVQQILETQKELVQQNGDLTSQVEKKDDAIGGTRQSSARQMNTLRDVIQNLTKSVNPFGKLMDFIPEDIDAMQLEMSMWRESYTQAANELKRERSLTESTTEPMKMQLVQIEANIKEYLEMIDASRTKILQNSDKILQMLTEQ